MMSRTSSNFRLSVAVIALLVIIASCAGCATRITVSPLVRASCPELPARDVVNMGDLALVAIEDAQQYSICRRAALGLKDKP